MNRGKMSHFPIEAALLLDGGAESPRKKKGPLYATSEKPAQAIIVIQIISKTRHPRPWLIFVGSR